MGIAGREFAERVLAWAGGSSQVVWLICMLGVCAGAVLTGVVASKVVEWPVLRLRDRFFPSRSQPLPVAGVETQATASQLERDTRLQPFEVFLGLESK
jgi:peptidoglycan/LPS O-acetylase OafA/YrhL